MTKSNQKSTTVVTPVAKTEKKAPRNVLITLPKGTKNAPQNFIVPAGLMGKKERWFIKANLISHKAGSAEGTFDVILSERGAKERGLDVAKLPTAE